jgi:hypothetical protein
MLLKRDLNEILLLLACFLLPVENATLPHLLLQNFIRLILQHACFAQKAIIVVIFLNSP